uniref:Uncharacterized protein n=1 Tax=Onchocerca volvulus TaxID=6282 RepID=A0A8R1XS35_ONCVO
EYINFVLSRSLVKTVKKLRKILIKRNVGNNLPLRDLLNLEKILEFAYMNRSIYFMQRKRNWNLESQNFTVTSSWLLSCSANPNNCAYLIHWVKALLYAISRNGIINF